MSTIRKRSPIPRKASKPTARQKGKKQLRSYTWWRVAAAGLVLILLSPFYYGYVLKTFSSTWRWVMDIGENPNYRNYKSFNIRIPSGYNKHGIDVSYAQGKIDWRKVAAMTEDSVKITFAFIKATEGLLTVDPYFKRNWREAPKAGVICGAYHFLRPTKNGAWQARFFLQNVKMEPGDLPAVADIERLDGTSPEAMRKELKAFLKIVENKTHVRPLIYTNISFYQDYLSGYFDNYPIWIAHYYQPRLKAGRDLQWEFWQHSDKGRVNGISHVVDFNVFRGDSLSFQKLLMR